MLQSQHSNISENGWHHIAFSYDESGVHLFVDGVLKSSNVDVTVDTSVAALSNIVLGSNMEGLLDNVKLFDTALSTEQIQHLAFSGNYDLELSNKVTELQFNEFQSQPKDLKNESGTNATVTGTVSYADGFVEGSKSIVLNSGGVQLTDNVSLNALSMSAWVNMDNFVGDNLLVGNDNFKLYLNTSNIKMNVGGTDVAVTTIDQGVVPLKGERFNLNFNAANDLDASPDATNNNQGIVTTTVNNGSFSNDILSYPNASFYADKLTLSSWVKTNTQGTLFDLGGLQMSVKSTGVDIDVAKYSDIKKTFRTFDTNIDNIDVANGTGINGTDFSGNLFGSNSIDFTLNTNNLTKIMPTKVSFILPFRNYSPKTLNVYGVNDGVETIISQEQITFRNKLFVNEINIPDTGVQYDSIRVKYEGNGFIRVRDMKMSGANYSYSIAYTGQTEDVSSINNGTTDLLTKDGDKLVINLNEGVTVNAKVLNITANTTTEIANVSNGFTIGLDSGNVGDEFFVELTDSSGTSYTSNKVNVSDVVASSGKRVTVHVWGAGGGSGNYSGGSGGYTYGTFDATLEDAPYLIVVGQAGLNNSNSRVYGGGGGGSNHATAGHVKGGSGGGFSGIFKKSSNNNFKTANSTEISEIHENALLVAGGGGGGGSGPGGNYPGGSGGGLVGQNAASHPAKEPTGGTQTSGGKALGQGYVSGGKLSGANSGYPGGGGGGGYYGGGGGGYNHHDNKHSGGAGGSGYVSSSITGETQGRTGQNTSAITTDTNGNTLPGYVNGIGNAGGNGLIYIVSEDETVSFTYTGSDQYWTPTIVPNPSLNFDTFNKLTVENITGTPSQINLTFTPDGSTTSQTIDVGTATTITISQRGKYKAQIVTDTGIFITDEITISVINILRPAIYSDFEYHMTRIKSTWDNYDTTYSTPMKFSINNTTTNNNLSNLGYTEGMFSGNRWWILNSETHDFATYGTGSSVKHYNWSNNTAAVNQGSEYAWFTRTIPDNISIIDSVYTVRIISASLVFDGYNKLTIENPPANATTTLKFTPTGSTDTQSIDIGTATSISISKEGTYSATIKNADSFTFTDEVTVSEIRDEALAKADNASITYGAYVDPDGFVYDYPGYSPNTTVPIKVPGVGGVGFLSNIKLVSRGGTQTLALSNDGKVYAWGHDNSTGSFGTGNNTTNNIHSGGYPVEVPWSGGAIHKIHAGHKHTLICTVNGDLYTTGENRGCLGHGDATNRNTFTKVSNMSGITDMTSGDDWSLVLNASTGKAYSCGYNTNGQLSINNGNSNTNTFQVVKGNDGNELTNISKVSGGHYHSIFLVNGEVYTSGYGGNGEQGDGSNSDNTTATKITFPDDVTIVDILGTYYNGFAKTSDGKLYVWGKSGNTTAGTLTSNSNTPVLVTSIDDIKYLYCYPRGNEVLAMKNDYTLWGWGPSWGSTPTQHTSFYTPKIMASIIERFPLNNGSDSALRNDNKSSLRFYKNTNSTVTLSNTVSGDWCTSMWLFIPYVTSYGSSNSSDIPSGFSGYTHNFGYSWFSIMAWTMANDKQLRLRTQHDAHVTEYNTTTGTNNSGPGNDLYLHFKSLESWVSSELIAWHPGNSSNSIFMPEAWHHMAWEYKSDTGKFTFYCDGIEQVSGTMSTGLELKNMIFGGPYGSLSTDGGTYSGNPYWIVSDLVISEKYEKNHYLSTKGNYKHFLPIPEDLATRQLRGSGSEQNVEGLSAFTSLQFDGYNKLTIKNPPDNSTTTLKFTPTGSTDTEEIDIGTATSVTITKEGTYSATIKNTDSFTFSNEITIDTIETGLSELKLQQQIDKAFSYYAYSYSMNADGTRLVVNGSSSNSDVYIYDIIDGTLANEKKFAKTGEGFSCVMSQDGNTVFASYRGQNIDIYNYSSNTWTKTTTLNRPGGRGEWGFLVDCNGDGSILTVIDRTYNSAAGLCDIYHKSSDGTWSQIPTQTIYGSHTWSAMHSVSINAAGDRLVIGEPGWHASNRDQASSKDGKCYIYELNSGGSWTRTFTISAPRAGKYFGYKIYMNDDGNAFITSDSHSGYYYKFDGSSWNNAQEFKFTIVGNMALSDNRILISESDATAGYHLNVYDYDSTSDSWVMKHTIQKKFTAGYSNNFAISKNGRVAFLANHYVTSSTSEGYLYIDVPTSLSFDGYNKLTIENPPANATTTLKFTPTGSTETQEIDIGTATSITINASGLGTYSATIKSADSYVFTEEVTVSQLSEKYELKTSGDTMVLAANSSGQKIELSADGNTLAYTTSFKLWIYEYKNNSWEKRYESPNLDDDGISAVALSGDGNHAAVGSWTYPNGNDQQGRVYTFSKVNGSWTRKSDIANPGGQNNFGTDVKINYDGTRLFATRRHAGDIHVYKRTDVTTNWTTSTSIDGPNGMGQHIAINNLGTMVSAFGYNDNKVRTWENTTGDTWTPRTDLSIAPTDYTAYGTIAMNNSGSRIYVSFNNSTKSIIYSVDWNDSINSWDAATKKKIISSDDNTSKLYIAHYRNLKSNASGDKLIVSYRDSSNNYGSDIYELTSESWNLLYTVSEFGDYGYACDINDDGSRVILSSIGSVGKFRTFDEASSDTLLFDGNNQLTIQTGPPPIVNKITLLTWPANWTSQQLYLTYKETNGTEYNYTADYGSGTWDHHGIKYNYETKTWSDWITTHDPSTVESGSLVIAKNASGNNIYTFDNPYKTANTTLKFTPTGSTTTQSFEIGNVSTVNIAEPGKYSAVVMTDNEYVFTNEVTVDTVQEYNPYNPLAYIFPITKNGSPYYLIESESKSNYMVKLSTGSALLDVDFDSQGHLITGNDTTYTGNRSPVVSDYVSSPIKFNGTKDYSIYIKWKYKFKSTHDRYYFKFGNTHIDNYPRNGLSQTGGREIRWFPDSSNTSNYHQIGYFVDHQYVHMVLTYEASTGKHIMYHKLSDSASIGTSSKTETIATTDEGKTFRIDIGQDMGGQSGTYDRGTQYTHTIAIFNTVLSSNDAEKYIINGLEITPSLSIKNNKITLNGVPSDVTKVQLKFTPENGGSEQVIPIGATYEVYITELGTYKAEIDSKTKKIFTNILNVTTLGTPEAIQFDSLTLEKQIYPVFSGYRPARTEASIQKFWIPKDGDYKIEMQSSAGQYKTWGHWKAYDSSGGYGSKLIADIHLTKGTYIILSNFMGSEEYAKDTAAGIGPQAQYQVIGDWGTLPGGAAAIIKAESYDEITMSNKADKVIIFLGAAGSGGAGGTTEQGQSGRHGGSSAISSSGSNAQPFGKNVDNSTPITFYTDGTGGTGTPGRSPNPTTSFNGSGHNGYSRSGHGHETLEPTTAVHLRQHEPSPFAGSSVDNPHGYQTHSRSPEYGYHNGSGGAGFFGGGYYGSGSHYWHPTLLKYTTAHGTTPTLTRNSNNYSIESGRSYVKITEIIQ